MIIAKLYDLVKVITNTVGTGTITLGSADPGYLDFTQAGVQDGDVVSYGIEDGDNTEVGRGTYSSSGGTLARTTVLKSTNSDNPIALSGNAFVYITALAEDINTKDWSQLTDIPNTISGYGITDAYSKSGGLISGNVTISGISNSGTAALSVLPSTFTDPATAIYNIDSELTVVSNTTSVPGLQASFVGKITAYATAGKNIALAGGYFEGILGSSHAGASAFFVGLQVNTTVQAGAAGTVNEYDGIVVTSAIAGAGTVAITTSTLLKINPYPSLNGTSLTNLYGIFIGNISGAATINYSIRTNTGMVFLGDSVGIKLAPISDTAINVLQNKTDPTASQIGMQVESRALATTGANSQLVYAFYSLTRVSSATTQNVTGDIHSGHSQIQVDSTTASVSVSRIVGQWVGTYVSASAQATATSAHGLEVTLSNLSTAGGKITTGAMIYLNAPVTTGAITNLYGIYIENISGAATANYAIYTGSGNHSYGGSLTVASAAGATWNGIEYRAATATVSGSTNISAAAGFNYTIINAPTISAASALTITNAATLKITGAPIAGGAGPATITNAYALWIASGNTYLAGSLGVGVAPSPSIQMLVRTVPTDPASEIDVIYGQMQLTTSSGVDSQIHTSLFGSSVVLAASTQNVTGSIRGVQGSASVSSTNTITVSNVWGIYTTVYLNSNAAASVTNMYGAYVDGGNNSAVSGATVTSYRGVFVNTPLFAGNMTTVSGVYIAPMGNAKATNVYGVYIGDQANGGTLNYAIYTNLGLVHFGDNVDLASGKVYKINTTQVVAARVTGYGAMTGTGNKATVYDTSSITLVQLATRVKQLQDDLTTHGLIGS